MVAAAGEVLLVMSFSSMVSGWVSVWGCGRCGRLEYERLMLTARPLLPLLFGWIWSRIHPYLTWPSLEKKAGSLSMYAAFNFLHISCMDLLLSIIHAEKCECWSLKGRIDDSNKRALGKVREA